MWPIGGSRQTGSRGQGSPLNRRTAFSDASAALRGGLWSGLWVGEEGFGAWFCGVWHGVWAWFRNRAPIRSAYRTSPQHDKWAHNPRQMSLTKRRARIHHRQVDVAELHPLVPDPPR